MLKTILVFLIILYGDFHSQKRSTTDSLYQESLVTQGEAQLSIFFQLATLYKDSSLDLGFEYSKKALELSYKLKNNQARARALLSMSFYDFLRYKMPESTRYLLQARTIYKTLGDSTGVAKSYVQEGLIKWRQGKLNSALKSYLSALKIFKIANDLEGIANSLNYIGLVYWKRGDYPQALENLIASLQIKNNIGNKYEIGLTLNNIGKLYNELKNYQKSIGYSEQALVLSDLIANKYVRGRALNNLGLSFAGLGAYQKALKYLKNAEAVKQLLDDKAGMGFSDQDIGNIYKLIGNSEKALEYYKKSLAIRKKIKDAYGISSILLSIARLQIESNNLNSAYLSINRSKNIAENLGAKNFLKDSYKLLSDYYAKKSAFHKAYIYFSKYSMLEDSLFNDSNIRRIAEMDAKYKIDKIQKEVDTLKQQEKIRELEIQRGKSLRIFLIFTSLLLLLFAGLVYSRAHLKKKTYTLLEEKNNELKAANKRLYDSETELKELNETKDKFFSIIAHDLKNPFNSIMGFYDMLVKEYKDLSDDEKLEYITAMGSSINNSYSLLDNLLQWSRSQMGAINIEKQELQLNALCTSAITGTLTQAKSKKIKISKSCPNGLLAYADRFMIETVIRNLLTNAIKFTNENGKIALSAQTKDDAFVEIIIEDNGIGISNEVKDNLFKMAKNQSTLGTSNESGTGLGLLICKEFVEKNGGRLSVESEKEKGSKFIFTLPASLRR